MTARGWISTRDDGTVVAYRVRCTHCDSEDTKATNDVVGHAFRICNDCGREFGARARFTSWPAAEAWIDRAPHAKGGTHHFREHGASERACGSVPFDASTGHRDVSVRAHWEIVPRAHRCDACCAVLAIEALANALEIAAEQWMAANPHAVRARRKVGAK